MLRLNDKTLTAHACEYSDRLPTPLTYRRIAEILAERDGTAMTRMHIARMCRSAERKIAHACMTDPVIREQL